MSSVPDIDIILPCYNPVKGWATVVRDQLQLLRSGMPGVQIRAIVVNDGTVFEDTDTSLSLLNQENDIHVVSYSNNMGKGFAIRSGVQHSTAPVVIYTDIDFPYTLESMLDVIAPVREGTADVALAVRNATYYSKLPTFRRWMSKILRSANRIILGLHTSDTQGGLKAFNQKSKEVFLRTNINRYLFDLEFVYRISKAREIRIKTVEADLREGIVMSPVRMKIILAESWNFLKVLVKSR